MTKKRRKTWKAQQGEHDPVKEKLHWIRRAGWNCQLDHPYGHEAAPTIYRLLASVKK